MVNPKGSEYRKKENIKRFFYPHEWIKFYDDVPENLKFHFNFLMQTGARYHELSKVLVEDIIIDRKVVDIKFPKTRVGGLRKIKVLCSECQNKSYLSKTLKFCQWCGHPFSNLEEFQEQYQKQILNRRKEIRRVKISSKFLEEIKSYVRKNKLGKKDNFGFKTIQYMGAIIKRILKKQEVKDWQDFSVHNIRKTHENYLIATGSNPLALKMHMGHAIDVATAYYISVNVFTQEEIGMIKIIIGDLKI